MRQRNKLERRVKPEDFNSHWPKLIENLQFSSQEFYRKVEAALAERKVPDLKIERVDWKEGGLLSPRREYLQLSRERLIFDICGAPFGTGFFVSVWFRNKPLRFGLLAWLLVVVAAILGVALAVALNLSWYTLWRMGIRTEPTQIATVMAAVIGVALIGVVVIVGPNLDQFLMQPPVIGYIYERYFRKITLYRKDLAEMYKQAVNSAVAGVIDELTKAQGIPPLSEFDRGPVSRQLFQPQGGNGHK